MKKIVLEEVNRIRDIIGLKPLILEKSGTVNELTDLISHVYGKGGAQTIDDYIASMGRRITFPGETADEALDSWTKLYDYMKKSVDQATGARIYTNIDSVIPGLADSLVTKIFSEEATSQLGLKFVSNQIFPEELVKAMKLWDLGELTAQKALSVRQDVLDLIGNLKNPQIKQAYFDLATKNSDNLFKNLINDTPAYQKRTLEGAELQKEVSALKKRLTKKDYELTQKDIAHLDDAKFFGQITDEEWRNITSIKYENAAKYWRLYDEFKGLKSTGKIDSSLSFEDWLINTAKAKSPDKMTSAAIKSIRFVLQPFLRVLGITKVGSFGVAFAKVGGLTVSSILFALNDLLELVQAGGEEGAEWIGAKKYNLLADKRLNEYWQKDPPKVTFDNKTYVPIFGSPDEVNYDIIQKFKNNPPKVTIIDAEKNLISIIPDTISLGGKMVSEFYFVLADTVLGFGENSFNANEDVIIPKSTNVEVNQEETPKEEKSDKGFPVASGEYETIDAKPEEIDAVFKKMRKEGWAPNDEDKPFVKKVDDGTGKKFEFEGGSGTKYFITID